MKNSNIWPSLVFFVVLVISASGCHKKMQSSLSDSSTSPALVGLSGQGNLSGSGATPPYQTAQQINACLSGSDPVHYPTSGTDPATGFQICSVSGVVNLSSPSDAIIFSKSGYMLQGTGTDKTVIRRMNAAIQSMIYFSGSNIHFAISNLSVDGNRFAIPAADGMGCIDGFTDSYIDLNATGASEGLIDQVKFYNAPGTAVETLGGVTLNNCEIWNARTTGVHLYYSGGGVQHSRIYQSGTAAITVHGTGQLILDNKLVNNRYEQPDKAAGGQMVLEHGSSGAVVDHNTIDGSGLYYTPASGTVMITDHLNGGTHPCPVVPNLDVDGIEGYGTGHGIYDNEILGNSGGGMNLKGTTNYIISGFSNNFPGDHSYSIHDNGYGIRIMHDGDTGRDNSGLILDYPQIIHNLSPNLYGLSLENMVGSGGGWSSVHPGACIVNNAGAQVTGFNYQSQYDWHMLDLNCPFGRAPAPTPVPTPFPTPVPTPMPTPVSNPQSIENQMQSLSPGMQSWDVWGYDYHQLTGMTAMAPESYFAVDPSRRYNPMPLADWWSCTQLNKCSAAMADLGSPPTIESQMQSLTPGMQTWDVWDYDFHQLTGGTIQGPETYFPVDPSKRSNPMPLSDWWSCTEQGNCAAAQADLGAP